MPNSSKRLSKPEKLFILTQLRERAGLTQSQVAARFGLTGTTGRLTVGNWERDVHPADEAKRAVFLDYLWFDLGLRRDLDELRRVWDILAEQWGWAPLRDHELIRDPPFKGLDSYDVGDAKLFFGREQLTAQLVNHVRHYPLLVVVGASGSGKSSLVRAGLVAALQSGLPLADGTLPPEGSSNWRFHIITPTSHPLAALAQSISAGGEVLTAEELARDPAGLAHYVRRRLVQEASAAQPSATRLLLVVDQFEELFTECHDPSERKAFIENLLTPAILTEPIVVVIALRADFYDRCAGFNRLRIALEKYQRYIGRMSADELRAAIEQPARDGGWEFEPGLVELLLHEVGNEPGNLPLLSHALLATWKQRQGVTLTLAAYTAVGRVNGAIATTANAVFDKLNEEQQRIARRIFLRLTNLGEDTQETRHRVTRDKLVYSDEERPIVEEVLTILAHAEARLITISKDEVEVAHEALIRAWGTLRKWLENDREELLLRGRLTDAAQTWDDLERTPDALYRGLPLQSIWDWAQDHRGELNEVERAFLDASYAEEERAQLAKAAAFQRELAQERELAAALQGKLAQERELANAHKQRASAARRALWSVSTLLLMTIISAAIAGAVYYGRFSRGQAVTLLEEAETLRQEPKESTAQATAQAAKLKVREAAGWSPEQVPNLEEALVDIDRQIATDLVQKGEKLLRTVQSRLEDGQALAPIEQLALQHAARKAFANFQAALALNPPPDTPLYIFVSGGLLQMGASDADPYADADERPQHTVTLAGYWISRTEVTNEQFRRCVEAGECNTPNTRFFDPARAAFPVTGVTWWQARDYARWIGGRLPTEAEWEWACRGEEGNRLPWGDTAPTPIHFNFQRVWQEVGTHPAGASTFGLYDMIGNAGEWTSSLYQTYPTALGNPLLTPAPTDRIVIRGQPFYGHEDCSVRNEAQASEAPVNAGFRVVFTVPFATAPIAKGLTP